MAKAVNPAGKKLSELTDEEREAEDLKYHQKHQELDRMKAKQDRRNERMERINPMSEPYPLLSVEEVEEIESELPDAFTDDDIEKALKKKGIDKNARSEKMRQEREKSKINPDAANK